MKTLFACFMHFLSGLWAGGRARGTFWVLFPAPVLPHAWLCQPKPPYCGLVSPTSFPALGGLPVNSHPLGGIVVPGPRKLNRGNGFGTNGQDRSRLLRVLRVDYLRRFEFDLIIDVTKVERHGEISIST